MSRFRYALGVLIMVAGCTSGQVSPPKMLPSANIAAQTKLQVAVGTANVAGAIGLNVQETMRQQNGLASVTVNAPTIVGPANFIVPSTSDAGIDAGTNKITGALQPTVYSTPYPSTFGFVGGAFGDGFAPSNLTTGTFQSLTPYALPFYAGANPQLFFIGGPPAWPQVRNGTYPSGFSGYTEGFTDFMATPVSGTYTLNDIIPTGVTTTVTLTASANMTQLTPLPQFQTPVLVPDSNGDGGATINVTVPAGVTEAYVNVVNMTGSCYPAGQFAPFYYTILTRKTGAQVITLPANLGAPPVGSSATTPTLCTAAQNTAAGTSTSGDTYIVYAVGVDYPAFEASYPQSTSQTPTIFGTNGQADITVSAASSPTTMP